MGSIHGANRHEVSVFPERLDDSIPEDHPVRFLDAFVDPLKLEVLGFQRATPATPGRPASNPAALLKLYLYGYLYRLRSSRRLVQASHRHGALLWLLKKLRPAHQTSADFRQNNLAPLRQVWRECTRLCQQLALCAGERVAIDGSQCKAGNAKERNCTPDKRKRRLQQIDQRVEGYRKALDCGDSQEEAGTPGGAVAENVPAKLEALQPRQRLSEAWQAQLEASGETPLSLTESESRAMKLGQGRGPEGCYNVQTAVDRKHQLMIAHDGTNDVGDRAWLSPRALQTQAVLRSGFDAVVDGGSYHGEEGKPCLEAGLPPYVARPISSANQQLGLFSKDDFTYESATDT